VFCLSARNSERRKGKDLAPCSQLQLGLAHRTVRCARLVRVNSPLSGLDDGVWLKITGPSGESSVANSSPSGKAKGRHGYNSRWCTGLSGEPTAACANGRPRNLHATRGLLQRSAGASDCPVCTGQCPVRQSAQRSNGRICHIWKEIVHRTVYMTCLVAHQTVRCATRQKARIAFLVGLQRLLAALGL
jgi:hypothetical protein